MAVIKQILIVTLEDIMLNGDQERYFGGLAIFLLKMRYRTLWIFRILLFVCKKADSGAALHFMIIGIYYIFILVPSAW